MAENLEEVKGLVTRTLDAQGVLAKLKAEIRSHVFTAILEQQQLENPSATSPLSQACSAREGALLALSLVHDFLAHYSLSSTAAVLRPESNVDDGVIVQGAALASSLVIPASSAASGQSLLERLISSRSSSNASSTSASASSSAAASKSLPPLKPAPALASKFNFSSDAAPQSRPAVEQHSPSRKPSAAFPDDESPDTDGGQEEGMSNTVKHNPFPPSVSRSSAPAAPSHTSVSSRAPPSTQSNVQHHTSRVDSASSSAAAASPAPAPAVFRRETISDDDEIKSEYEDSFEDESSHSRKGEHSLDGISVSDHSIDNSHGDSYDMVEAAANDAGAALF